MTVVLKDHCGYGVIITALKRTNLCYILIGQQFISTKFRRPHYSYKIIQLMKITI